MDDLLERLERRLSVDDAPAPAEKPKRRSTVRWTIPGFGPMTRISTSFGEVHAQALRRGDQVRTQSGQNSAITYIDRIKLDREFMESAPDSYPVMIRAGALGGGLPKSDILVSGEQLLGMGRHAFDVRFVKASELLGRPGILRKPEDIMTYTVFHCDEPVSVRMEGIWAKIELA